MSLITPMLTNGRIVPAAGGITALAYQTHTNGSGGNGSITMPTLDVGDIIVIAQSASGNLTPAYGTGFTGVTYAQGNYNDGETSTASTTMCLSFKIAESGDSGSSIGGFLNGGTEKYSLFIYRPTGTATTVVAQDINSVSYTRNPASDTITASASSEFTISVAAVIRGSASGAQGSFTTFSPTPDATTSGHLMMKALAQNPATSTDVTADAAAAGAFYDMLYVGCYLEVS